jgi:hypothetical protein
MASPGTPDFHESSSDAALRSDPSVERGEDGIDSDESQPECSLASRSSLNIFGNQ